jgi:putative membrane protein
MIFIENDYRLKNCPCKSEISGYQDYFVHLLAREASSGGIVRAVLSCQYAAMFSGQIAPSYYRYALIFLVLVILAWSGWHPKDQFTWFLEVAPVLIGLPLLILTFRSFSLTSLAYALLALHAVILMVGGHYTYAEMPLFSWLRDTFELARNHYDRVGHVAQGFIPAIVVREILLRRSPLQPGKWLFFMVSSVCLAISACYEFLEWWVALASGDEAVAFLATQGDVWDTQWDMFLALCGAIVSQLMFARMHDRQLAELE